MNIWRCIAPQRSSRKGLLYQILPICLMHLKVSMSRRGAGDLLPVRLGKFVLRIRGAVPRKSAFGPYAGSKVETQHIMNTIQQCKPKTAMNCHGRGIPNDTLNGSYNSAALFQGCGLKAENMWRVEQALFSMYSFGFILSSHAVTDNSGNNYLNAGKSPFYIKYSRAVGGLIKIDDFEVGALNTFAPLVMEQAYAELLLPLQNWVQEALENEDNI